MTWMFIESPTLPEIIAPPGRGFPSIDWRWQLPPIHLTDQPGVPFPPFPLNRGSLSPHEFINKLRPLHILPLHQRPPCQTHRVTGSAGTWSPPPL